jgi:hypothetical protein
MTTTDTIIPTECPQCGGLIVGLYGTGRNRDLISFGPWYETPNEITLIARCSAVGCRTEYEVTFVATSMVIAEVDE